MLLIFNLILSSKNNINISKMRVFWKQYYLANTHTYISELPIDIKAHFSNAILRFHLFCPIIKIVLIGYFVRSIPI